MCLSVCDCVAQNVEKRRNFLSPDLVLLPLVHVGPRSVFSNMPGQIPSILEESLWSEAIGRESQDVRSAASTEQRLAQLLYEMGLDYDYLFGGQDYLKADSFFTTVEDDGEGGEKNKSNHHQVTPQGTFSTAFPRRYAGRKGYSYAAAGKGSTLSSYPVYSPYVWKQLLHYFEEIEEALKSHPLDPGISSLERIEGLLPTHTAWEMFQRVLNYGGTCFPPHKLESVKVSPRLIKVRGPTSPRSPRPNRVSEKTRSPPSCSLRNPSTSPVPKESLGELDGKASPTDRLHLLAQLRKEKMEEEQEGMVVPVWVPEPLRLLLLRHHSSESSEPSESQGMGKWRMNLASTDRHRMQVQQPATLLEDGTTKENEIDRESLREKASEKLINNEINEVGTSAVPSVAVPESAVPMPSPQISPRKQLAALSFKVFSPEIPDISMTVQQTSIVKPPKARPPPLVVADEKRTFPADGFLIRIVTPRLFTLPGNCSLEERKEQEESKKGNYHFKHTKEGNEDSAHQTSQRGGHASDHPLVSSQRSLRRMDSEDSAYIKYSHIYHQSIQKGLDMEQKIPLNSSLLLTSRQQSSMHVMVENALAQAVAAATHETSSRSPSISPRVSPRVSCSRIGEKVVQHLQNRRGAAVKQSPISTKSVKTSTTDGRESSPSTMKSSASPELVENREEGETPRPASNEHQPTPQTLHWPYVYYKDRPIAGEEQEVVAALDATDKPCADAHTMLLSSVFSKSKKNKKLNRNRLHPPSPAPVSTNSTIENASHGIDGKEPQVCAAEAGAFESSVNSRRKSRLTFSSATVPSLSPDGPSSPTPPSRPRPSRIGRNRMG